MFALDTNTLIYFFKGQGDVARHLLAQPPQHIAIPAIVQFELEVGVLKSSAPQKRQQQLNQLLRVVRILPFDDDAARQAADIRVTLEQQGQPIGPYDLLIAATARANQAILVTHNQREFCKVPGLQLADWF
ncbi:type II toxin-antitoxin system VapC family toxin [Alkalimonas sp. NCh-2]|uniref:type II toxin-antitoxin system VapC family toxin n=1 Tax=Alkalimonas sp. NCh-2 TaxID=3144846 RepID=UPI0031F6B3B2